MRRYVEAIAKHLPPSASTLELADVGGQAGGILSELRPELRVTPLESDALGRVFAPDSADAVVAVNPVLTDDFLNAAWEALRPGGRLIMVDTRQSPDDSLVRALEATSYIRILVEPALADAPGVLMRGEKPHRTANTLERIARVARQEETALDWTTYRKRFVYLLVRQTPNKPVWKLEAGEVVRWHAVALAGDGQPALLAFSSLPRAVGFMQPAVLKDTVRDVSRIAKFERAVAEGWGYPALINPTLEQVNGDITLVEVNPDDATTPDE